MRFPGARSLFVTFLFIGLLVMSGCEAIDETKEKITDTYGKSGLTKEIEEMYKKAQDAGERVPNSVMEWAKQDIRRMNDWEYKVIESGSMGLQEREDMLNEKGRERWECFWIEERGESRRLHFKRPARSYLKHIPLKDLLKIFPDEGS